MEMTKSKIFLIGCLAFIIGTGLAAFLPEKIIRLELWWFSLTAGCLVAVILSLLDRRDVARKDEAMPRLYGGGWTILLLFGLCFFLGLWRYALSLPDNSPDKIWHYNGRTVLARGIIVNEPDRRQGNQKLEINVSYVDLSGKDAPAGRYIDVSGKILVTTDLYPGHDYGDYIEMICGLEAPEEFKGFAYDRYLARRDIYSVCYYPYIKSFSPEVREGYGARTWFYKKIFALKDKLRAEIDSGLGEPEAGLTRAIMLGDMRGIPDDLRAVFSQVGLSHIISISGSHISILSAMAMGLLLGLGFTRSRAFYGAVLFLGAYIILVGCPASALRSGIMGFLVLWALNLGRLNKSINSLVLAAAIMLLINPRLLRDDIGFQLSFLAVLGMVQAYPTLEDWSDRIKIPKLKGLRSVFNLTLAAQVFTLPIIVYNFGVLSLISPLANLLALWVFPPLMASVMVGWILSFIFSNLAPLFFLPAGLIFKYLIGLSRLLSEIPYSYVFIEYLWSGWAILYFLTIIILIVRFRKSVV
ncbi:MAG: ComEC/Rec2 family competence protein [Candidatus Falkowbacteria bacterium]